MRVGTNHICKTLIKTDENLMTENLAKKLNKIIDNFGLELTVDGFYVGTSDSCRSVYSIITDDETLFNSLLEWKCYDTYNNSCEDCISTHLNFIQRRNVM